MARRDEIPEPEITPADPEDVAGTEPVPGTDVTDVDTVGQPDAEDEAKEDRPPFMSEGVRQDLLTFGKATDPASGGVFERDEDGKVTFTTRRGKVTTFDVKGLQGQG
jgi:hypothetical protein